MPLLLALLLLASGPAAAQVDCRTLGALTTCTHGAASPQNGEDAAAAPGAAADRADGAAAPADPLRLSDRVIDNQGNSWRDLEGSTYGADGTICQRLGHFLLCN